MTTLVSACLLGFPCRHDGLSKRSEAVLALLDGEEVVPVCPEVAGGLSVPRAAAFVEGERVFDVEGRDVSAQFAAGAALAVVAAARFGARLAVLKENSPSCGTKMIGTRAGRAEGMGIAARALALAGIAVCSEDSLAAHLKERAISSPRALGGGDLSRAPDIEAGS